MRKSTTRKHRLEPAYSVIMKCGGSEQVRRVCGLATAVAVNKWMMPRDKGGTGGVIPADRQQELVAWSMRQPEPPITPADFFPAARVAAE